MATKRTWRGRNKLSTTAPHAIGPHGVENTTLSLRLMKRLALNHLFSLECPLNDTYALSENFTDPTFDSAGAQR